MEQDKKQKELKQIWVSRESFKKLRTDQAFADAGVNLEDYDTDAENETLKDILLYHVISGAAVDAANVTDGMTAEAANGDLLTFSVDNDTVMIGDATVTAPDERVIRSVSPVSAICPPSTNKSPAILVVDEAGVALPSIVRYVSL